jgi:glycosyltransferase involved in cell wall biosynthesis
MKVFFTLDSLALGGTERSTLDIVSKFSKDTTVKVVYFYPGDDLKMSYQKAGIALHDVQVKGKKNYISAIRSLIKLIKKDKPDIIVSSIARADLISRMAGLITGTPVIGTFVNDTYGSIRIQEQKERKLYLKFLVYWALDKWTALIPKYWISNCKSIAYSNGKALAIRAKKTQVIYRGRDTDQFESWAPSSTAEQFKFVFVGRLMERKGLGELLDVFIVLKKKYPHIHLDIYGAGGFGKQLLEKIEAAGVKESAILHGSVLNGFKKLYQAHCFMFPSWYEGFSGSLVEAMIAGIPIIASNITMNMEAVTDEKTALVFEVKNTQALEAKMERMILEYPQMIEMGARARKEALERFDIKVIANQYEQFLKDVVNKKVNQNQLI